MEIEADVYSGRPNPRWTLDEGHTEELSRRLGALPAAAPAPPFDGLGYRGLVVTGAPGGCDTVRLFRGQVRAECEGEPRAWTDAGRGLERWLAGTAAGQVEPATLDLLRRETGS